MKTIKMLMLLAISLFTCGNISAQTTAAGNNEVKLDVSKKMNLRDDIILDNYTQFTFDQVSVSLIDETGQTKILSVSKGINPSAEERIYTTSHNKLKELKGKTLSVKFVEKDGHTTNDFKVSIEEDSHDLHIKLAQ